MIIVTRPGITDEELEHLIERIESAGVKAHISRGKHRCIVGCIGDVKQLANVPLLAIAGVESVVPVLKPYKLAASEFAAAPSEFQVGPNPAVTVGGEALFVVAGPCSVEGADMLEETARAVARGGAVGLRGGAFKPRTSPYDFQGLGRQALEMLAAAREKTGLAVVTEVVDPRQVELVAEHADVLQVGARNMQNYPLLLEVGQAERPVLLKRGMSATIKELLLASEYIMSKGNTEVMLCERGIRTFGTATRNTFDVGAVAVLKRETHLPVIIDPSHAAGVHHYVAPLAFAGIAAGADGLIVEVHPRPDTALSDGNQSLTFAAFDRLMEQLAAFAQAAGRTVRRGGTEAG